MDNLEFDFIANMPLDDALNRIVGYVDGVGFAEGWRADYHRIDDGTVDFTMKIVKGKFGEGRRESISSLNGKLAPYGKSAIQVLGYAGAPLLTRLGWVLVLTILFLPIGCTFACCISSCIYSTVIDSRIVMNIGIVVGGLLLTYVLVEFQIKRIIRREAKESLIVLQRLLDVDQSNTF